MSRLDRNRGENGVRVASKKIPYERFLPRNCPVCSFPEWSRAAKRADGGTIVRCVRCGHFYLNPPIPKEALKEIYEKEYFIGPAEEERVLQVEKWLKEPDGVYQRTIAWLSENFKAPCGVLEAGCGIGSFLDALRQRGYSAAGIDPSAEAARLAKKKYGIDIHRGFLGESGSPRIGGPFQILCSFEVIEHVEDPVLFLGQCAKMLTEDGALVLSTPNFGLFSELGRAYTDSDRQEHIQFFTTATLERLLERCGFKVIRMETVGPVFLGERWQKKWTPYFFGTGFWQSVRSIRMVQGFKKMLIKSMNRIRTPVDVSGNSGNNILLFARKI